MMRAPNCIPLLLLGLIGSLAIMACGGSSGSVGAQTAGGEAGADAAVTEAMGFIPSFKAGEHLGENVTVRGDVFDYRYISGKKGRPYVLLFDVPATVERGSGISDMVHTKTFKVVVWKDDHKNFPSNFAAGYEGRTVCVTGVIEEFDGDVAIFASDPSQLEKGC